MGESFELLINAFFMNEIDMDEWITVSAAAKMTQGLCFRLGPRAAFAAR